MYTHVSKLNFKFKLSPKKPHLIIVLCSLIKNLNMFLSEFVLVRIVLKRSAQKSHRVPRNPQTANGPLGQLGPPVQQTAEEVLKRAKGDAIIPHLKTEDNIAEGTTSNTKNATSMCARTTSSYKPLNGAPTIIYPTATITRKGSESLAKLL